MSGKGLIEQIRHYQKDIERCPENSERMMRCIQRLYVLPILVQHLQETGVGRSVNSLRKYNGEVGDAAKALVAKWKSMVAAEECAETESDDKDTPKRSEKHNGDHHKKHKRHEKHHRDDSDDDYKKKKCKKRESKRKYSDSEDSSEKSDSDSESNNSGNSSEKSERRHRSHHKSKSSHKKHRSSSHCKKKTSKEKDDDIKDMIKENEKKVKKEVEEKKKNESKVKIERNEDGSIDHESGASFADVLMGVYTPPKKKKKTSETVTKSSSSLPKSSRGSSHSSSSSPEKPSYSDPFKMPEALSKPVKLEPMQLDISSTLPEILPHYKPLPQIPENMRRNSKPQTDEDTMFSLMTTKNLRTKVYSGVKTGSYYQVPSLYNLCLHLLSANIDALEFTGGVPYSILKPVLMKMNADQLYVLEHYNPYLVEDTDELWEFHCRKDFKKAQRQEMESWRDVYLRCMDEREKKLKAITSTINHSIAKSTPVRTAKLAYVDSVVKPPRNVAKKQARYGTASSSRPESKHELLTKAVLGGHTPGGEATTTVPAPPHSVSRNSSSSAVAVKKKKAPLMAKALQALKGNRFKR